MKKREKGPYLKEIFKHLLVNLVLSLIKYIQRTTTHTHSLFLYVGLDGGFFPSAKSINPHHPHKKITSTHSLFSFCEPTSAREREREQVNNYW